MPSELTSGHMPVGRQPGGVPIDRYDDFLAHVRTRFEKTTAVEGVRLFLTDTPAADLWETYLAAAPPEERASLTCGTCQRFIEAYGGLVTIDAKGRAASALWGDGAPAQYAAISRALAARVEAASVRDVFVSSATVLGKPEAGAFTHLSVAPPKGAVWRSVVANAGQAAAAKREERQMLQRALDAFPVALVRKALTLLKNGSLYRSEICEGMAKWLVDVNERLAAAKNAKLKDNLLWHIAASAAPGFCHVKGGMLGALLEDLGADMPFATVKARFDAKAHPLQYQRPQTAPDPGNIAQAEKIVAALASEGALARRFAKLADVECLWRPQGTGEVKPSGGGVFGHLKARNRKAETSTADTGAPATTMTWVKFAASVLPDAETIEFVVPTGNQPYMAMVTAVNADAPPLLQWDTMARRNPVSWYLYTSGSPPAQWNLVGGVHHPVSAVVLQPTMWSGTPPSSHHGESVCFVLKGSKDTNYKTGAGFFPSFLKIEYHGVRKTLEAHALAAIVAGANEAEVCGIRLTKGQPANLTFRVAAGGVRAEYRIDRWD